MLKRKEAPGSHDGRASGEALSPAGGSASVAGVAAVGDHPFNKYGWKYVWAEADAASGHHRERLTPPGVALGVHLSVTDRSHTLRLDGDGLGCTADKGWASVRASVGVKRGCWMYEVAVRRAGGTTTGVQGAQGNINGGHGPNRAQGCHVRVGWARREASVLTPVGYDSYAYGWRDLGGTVHESVLGIFEDASSDASEDVGFTDGDILGVYIELPDPGPDDSHADVDNTDDVSANRADRKGKRNTRKRATLTSAPEFSSMPPKTILAAQRDRIVIKYKNNLFYEARDYTPINSQPQLMADLVHFQKHKQAAAVQEMTSKDFPQLKGSKIQCFKNGVLVGTAFRDISNPIVAARLMSMDKRLAKEAVHKHGLQREEALVYGNLPYIPVKDDGSLGYYPMVSVFKGGSLTVNFGPDFKFPVPGAQGLHERVVEREVEACAWDIIDQVSNTATTTISNL